MTRPYPSSPQLGHSIEDIVTQTNANLAYFDATPNKSSVVLVERDLSLGGGYQLVDGVGFEPSCILFYYVGDGTSYGRGFGVWGVSDGLKNRCVYVDDSNSPSNPQWDSTRRRAGTTRDACIIFRYYTSTGSADTYAWVFDTHSNGFILQWAAGTTAGFNAKIIATCFK